MSGEVKIPAFWQAGAGDVPATTVHIDNSGTVVWRGEQIGVVEKGHRTYSPPLHKGSPVARYHKQVPEWHGWYGARGPSRRPQSRRDSRRQVLRDLITERIRREKLDGAA